MPIHRHACLSVTCDVCGQPLEDFEEYTVHFATEADARKLARHYRWAALAGSRFLCTERDPEHQAAMDELLPNLTFVHEGQLAIDVDPAP